jgi:hypothetical protein
MKMPQRISGGSTWTRYKRNIFELLINYNAIMNKSDMRGNNERTRVLGGEGQGDIINLFKIEKLF